MRTLVVKNLPNDLHERLKQLAKRNHRSVTKQVIQLIDSGVAGPPDSNDRDQSVTLAGTGGTTWDALRAAMADGRYARFGSQAELDTWMEELRADRREPEL